MIFERAIKCQLSSPTEIGDPDETKNKKSIVLFVYSFWIPASRLDSLGEAGRGNDK